MSSVSSSSKFEPKKQVIGTFSLQPVGQSTGDMDLQQPLKVVKKVGNLVD